MPKEAEARPTRDRRRAEQRRQVIEIARELAATLGTQFFESIVKHLAITLHADCAYLGELVEMATDRIRTIAVFLGHEPSQNFEHRLSGTAASNVLSDGSFFCNKDAKLRFPLDDLIQSRDAEAYIGVRLTDSAGQPLGLLAILSRNRFADLQVARSVVEVLVPRAAAELERKRVEDIHRENEERYHAFVSTNPDAMWRIELEQPVSLSLSEEQQIERICRFGYLAECNAALAELAGVESADNLAGCRFDEFANQFNPDAREELRQAIRAGFRSTTVEATPHAHKGRKVYRLRSQFGIIEDGALRRIWGTTRDITQLRQTELSLAASRKRFRDVLEGIQLPAVMLDVNGAVTFANECFLRMAELSMKEVSSLTWLTGIVPNRESETWKATLRPDYQGRHGTVHFEGTILPREGTPRVIAWDTIAVHDQDRQLAGIAALGCDITRQRALEMEIRQSQKLESVGRLAAGVAHDFNNLLMVVMGETGELLRRTGKSDPARDRLSAIGNAASQCAQLARQLLAFGRKQHLRPQLINLNDLITGDEGIIRSLIGQDIELLLNLESPIGLVFADPAQIQRALANLVTNARDAMTHGGTLVLATANKTIEAEDTMYPGVSAGAYIQLSVCDSGIGLTDEIRTHIFEPFFTTKPLGKGTGLGLATVYGIVAQSGGHIAVQGEPGKGTTFAILLPSAQGSEPRWN